MDRVGLSGSKHNEAMKAEFELFNRSPQDRQAAMNLYRKGRNMGYTATHTNYENINKFVDIGESSQTDFKNSYRRGRRLNPGDVKKIYAKSLANEIYIKKVLGERVSPSSYILAKNLESGKSLINLEKKRPVTLGVASHELGHAINSTTENKAYKLRQKLSYLPNIKATRTGKKPGLVKSTLGDLATIIEEGKASKNATKLLREAGASKEAIRLAEKTNKHAGDTYKHSAAFKFKARLRDMVDPIGKGNANYPQKSRYTGK